MGPLSELTMNWRTAMMIMAVLPLWICGAILLFRRVEASAARPFGLFLILASLGMGPQIIGFAGAYQLWPWITFFPLFYVDLWLAPLLILHTHRLIRNTPLGWRRWLFLPAGLQLIYYFGAFLIPGDGLFDTPAKWAFNDAVHEPIIVPVESVIGIGLMILAIVYIWQERNTYLAFLETHSSAARDYDPVWLRNIVIALIVAGVIYAGLELRPLFGSINYDADFPYQVGLMVVLSWLGLDAAWRLTSPFPKISASQSPASGSDDLADRVLDRMKEDSWYLEPRLSIRDVARRMGTNESYVSRALNQSDGSGTKMTFNQHVNQMRVEHARSLLTGSTDPILSVAMESGFNSKATFNRVFRDMVGQTPSRFRRSQNP
ncbi:MAG: AraC family transcriptional regulator [Pseudomonadota bacterium]